MYGYSTVFGIDVHARSTTVCALDPATGEVERRKFPGVAPFDEMTAWFEEFPGPRRGFYEAGCTGYGAARALTAGDTTVVPVAPHATPSSPASRARKNDRADAENLAAHGSHDELTVVWVPDPEVEGLRDASHAIEDLTDMLAQARQRVVSLLMRHDYVWTGEAEGLKRPRPLWGRHHREWLEGVDLGSPGSRLALDTMLGVVRELEEALREAVEGARKAAAASAIAPAIEAAQCLKGVGFLTALSVAAQIGDFERFGSGRKVTAYFGLAPRDGSTGDDVNLGRITKQGCSTSRRYLVEGAWVHSWCGTGPAARRPDVPREVASEAAKLSRRLTEHRRSMIKGGLDARKANVATAAETARFILFLGRDAMRAAAAAKAAES